MFPAVHREPRRCCRRRSCAPAIVDGSKRRSPDVRRFGLLRTHRSGADDVIRGIDIRCVAGGAPSSRGRRRRSTWRATPRRSKPSGALPSGNVTLPGGGRRGAVGRRAAVERRRGARRCAPSRDPLRRVAGGDDARRVNRGGATQRIDVRTTIRPCRSKRASAVMSLFCARVVQYRREVEMPHRDLAGEHRLAGAPHVGHDVACHRQLARRTTARSSRP